MCIPINMKELRFVRISMHSSIIKV